MIEGLVTALGVKLDLTGEEIADVLWLVAHMKEPDQVVEGVSQPAQDTQPSSDGRDVVADRPELPKEENESSREEANSSTEAKGELYPEDDRQGLNDLSFQVPDARSLREPLELARALKPLLHRVPSNTLEPVLDEEATVQRIADERIWAPVLQPALEPWLDLVLVVDESPSMLIWQRTVLEFKRILERYGVFRNASTWSLTPDGDANLKLCPGLGKIAYSQRPHSASELLDPNGRRLVVVASDCVSQIWQQKTVLPLLKLWSENGPLVIAQMLPQWLWNRTALGLAAGAEFAGLEPGVSNKRLITRPLSRRGKVNLQEGIKVPVVTLQSEEFSTWAGLLTGKGSTWAKGFVYSLETHDRAVISPIRQVPASLTAEERVQRFRITASPMARKLASLLASAPVINLPIVRIIQDSLLKDSRQVHVAEVFLGGLLEQVTEIGTDTKSYNVQFDFLRGVRELLLESVPKAEIIDVINEISVFVAENIGLTLDEFAAILRDPEDIQNQQLAGQTRSFARVTAKILRQLGGRYMSFAHQLETSLQNLEELSKSATKSDSSTSHLYEANLMIVGEGGAGKTTFAQKIVNSEYNLDPEEISTQGIDIVRWDFSLATDKNFRLNVWDFSGQEIYHATHQLFFTKHSLYIIVIDTRQENTDFHYWLSIIELLSDKCPVLVIKNEKQDRTCNINERALREEFVSIKEIFAVNLATNRGLSTVVERIKYHASRLGHVGNPLPQKWLDVRKALEIDNRNYISLDEYFRICEANGFERRDEQLLLSGYLHDLSVFLHFQNDFLLKHILILKPEWCTTAIYRVLDDREIIENRGFFSQVQLDRIWSARHYSSVKDELLELMVRFRLCYKVPSQPETYLAPNYLPFEQPDYYWDHKQNLILQYIYELMPKGIMPRLIVELFPIVEEQDLAWRNGVILLDEGARAEVIEHYVKKVIYIRVSGQRKRELLSTITSKIDKINDSYTGLQCRKAVACNCSKCINTQNPELYPLGLLNHYLKNDRAQVECRRSFEGVDIRSLIDGVLVTPITETIDIRTAISNLQPLQFEQLLFAVNPSTGLIPPSGVPMEERIQSLLKWAESSAGCGLEVLARSALQLSTVNISTLIGQMDEQNLDELLHELDSLIGLHNVKQEIRRIVNSEIANQRLIAAGHNPASAMKTRHLIFLGNPGTGKTTVARLIGKIFKALGLLKEGTFQEVDRANLVAGYVGQTALKTRGVVESALDGVLFIDEAYALDRSAGGFTDFGREAIETLVKMMENERNRLVVILAGYTREMNEFIATNPGIKSRIARIIDFPDYNGEDLFKIFLSLVQRDQLICPDNVQRRLRKVFNKMYASRDRSFGNGRDVRNFYERMVEQQKNRIVRNKLLEGDIMITFSISDIPDL